MIKCLQSILKFFNKSGPLPELTEKELILAEREKRIPFLGGGHFQGEDHVLTIGPGFRLSNQSNKAIQNNTATKIPNNHPAVLDH